MRILLYQLIINYKLYKIIINQKHYQAYHSTLIQWNSYYRKLSDEAKLEFQKRVIYLLKRVIFYLTQN